VSFNGLDLDRLPARRALGLPSRVLGTASEDWDLHDLRRQRERVEKFVVDGDVARRLHIASDAAFDGFILDDHVPAMADNQRLAASWPYALHKLSEGRAGRSGRLRQPLPKSSA